MLMMLGWEATSRHPSASKVFDGVRAPQGYFPEPTKRILVMYPRVVSRAEAFFRVNGLQVVTSSQYLGVFVRTKVAQDRWLGEKL